MDLELADCTRLNFDGMLTRVCSFSGTEISEGEFPKRGGKMMDEEGIVSLYGTLFFLVELFDDQSWRKFERISQESVGNGVMRSYVRPFLLFHLKLHFKIHYAARVANPSSLAQLTTTTVITTIYSVLCYP